MDYSDAYLRDSLPPFDPPAERVPPGVEQEIRSWRERHGTEDPELVARSTRWTFAMFQELRLGQVRTRWNLLSPCIRHLWIGLLDPESEGNGFGIGIPIAPGGDSHVVDRVYFPRLEAEFDLALSPGAIDLHSGHPEGATRTVWAQCNRTSLRGYVTAGHAIRSSRPSTPVALEDGMMTSLVRSCYPPIDAAFVLHPLPLPAPARARMRSFPAAGQPVHVYCRNRVEPRKIIRAEDTLGVVNTREFMIKFFIDQPCSAGDSGALVRAPSGEAVGIYVGAFTNPTSPSGRAGLAQHFEQAMLALDVTAYYPEAF